MSPLTDRRHSNHAFTLIELLVVISIIALLIGILLPALGAAREAARQAHCLSVIRQLAIANYAFETDNGTFVPILRKYDISGFRDSSPGSWPSGQRFHETLFYEGYIPRSDGEAILVCPVLGLEGAMANLDTNDFELDWAEVTYRINGILAGDPRIDNPSFNAVSMRKNGYDASQYAMSLDNVFNPSQTIMFSEDDKPAQAPGNTSHRFWREVYHVAHVDSAGPDAVTAGPWGEYPKTKGNNSFAFADGSAQKVQGEITESFSSNSQVKAMWGDGSMIFDPRSGD